eukprot:5272680-Prymnesium_polylepis.2
MRNGEVPMTYEYMNTGKFANIARWIVLSSIKGTDLLRFGDWCETLGIWPMADDVARGRCRAIRRCPAVPLARDTCR